MLDTIREYGLERLRAGGEADAAERRLAEHLADVAEQAYDELRGPEQALWLGRLEDDHANFDAALAGRARRGSLRPAAPHRRRVVALLVRPRPHPRGPPLDQRGAAVESVRTDAGARARPVRGRRARGGGGRPRAGSRARAGAAPRGHRARGRRRDRECAERPGECGRSARRLRRGDRRSWSGRPSTPPERRHGCRSRAR